jgi:hypothetical protein
MDAIREGNDLDACFVRSFKCVFFLFGTEEYSIPRMNEFHNDSVDFIE